MKRSGGDRADNSLRRKNRVGQELSKDKEVGFIRMGEVEKKPEEIREIGVGMLGYAFMGKAHSQAYIDMPIFFYPPPAKPRRVAIFGRTEDKVKEAAEKYGYETYYTDWRDVIKDDRVELVDNGLPNNLHRDPSIAAIEAGKHVLCEKPMAATHEEAKEMYEAARKSKVKHMVAFNYRFVPAVMLAKKLIDEGYIGKILQYRAVYLQEWIMDPKFELVWRLRKDFAGSGALGDLGAHIADLARYFVGEIKEVCALTKTFVEERPLPEDPEKTGKVDVDDAFIALLKFKSGAIGSMEATRFAAGRKNYERVEVHGSEGSIYFDLERLNELQVYSRRDRSDRMGFRNILVTESAHPYMEHWWPHGHIIGWEHTFIHEIHHLIDCIVNDKDVAPQGATFNDGLKNNEILEAVTRSSESSKWITLPL